jgi:hypothetical protein
VRNLSKAAVLCLAVLAACARGEASSGTHVEAAALVRATPAPTIATLERGQGPLRQALPVPTTDDESRALLAQNPGLQAFLAAEGRGWTVVFDRRSGQPMLLRGPGIAWVPGAGNTLVDTSDPSTSPVAKAQAATKALDSKVQSLLSSRPGLLGAFGDRLVLDKNWTGSPDGLGHTNLVTYRPLAGGVEQQGARVTFTVRHGNLVQIDAELLAAAPADLQPRMTDAQGLTRLREAAEVPGEPKLLDVDLKVVALAATAEAPGVYTGAVGRGYQPHLAYQYRFRLAGDTRTFVGQLDAQSGELLELYDDNRYGEVTGGIFPRTSAGAAELVVPFVDTLISNGSGKTTDLGGNYAYAPGIAATGLAGTNMKLNDNCGAPNGSVSGGDGSISLGTSTGTDCTFSTAAHVTRSGRNAFYHLNNVRRMGMKWMPGFNASGVSWMGGNVTLNVNISDTCNAYWDGSAVNFFKSGGGCANTGEISDVMQHEWGHGLDQNTKSGSVGDSAKGEAVADTVALLMTHDSCVGPGFFQSGSGGETTYCPSGVRDLARVITAANIASNCQKYPQCAGALGYECHCESHILSGAHWKLAQLFVSRYGAEEGWNRFEKGYLHALPSITAYMPNTAGNAYDAWMTADDDNGNLTDGTPNADIIFQAFNAQGIAGTQRPQSTPVCTPPAAPTATATAGVGKVSLAWTAPPAGSASAAAGAVTYSIFRSQAHNDGQGFLPLASGLTTLAFDDAQVAPGFAYSYQVVAVVSAGCASAYGTAVSATPTAPGPTAGADDFSLLFAPANVSFAQSTSTTVSVQTKLVAGSAVPITLTVTGLAAGVTGSFSPATVTAGQAATLTLTANSSATATNAAFNVVGTSGSLSRSAVGSLTVAAGGGGGGGGGCPPNTIDVAGVCVPGGCSCSTRTGNSTALGGLLIALGTMALMRRRRSS